MKKKWLPGTIVALAIAAGGFLAWQRLESPSLGEAFASGNGRIEAVEIDVATKTAGRIKEILAHEGSFVKGGEVLARMDTNALQTQLREADAQLKRAVIGVETAKIQVKQREAERAAIAALIAQREAEMEAAERRLARTEELAKRGTASLQTLDDDRAQFQSARAAVNAAKAQLAAAEAAILTAKAQVIDAESAVDAARATVERIQVEIDDSTLRSPRDGRVQYRIAEPGEVLPAGGRVLNLLDLSDVYMTFFLPTAAAGRVAIGAEVRLVLDALPGYVIPASVSFVADVAQFTPKMVETAEEREKLMFRVKANIAADLLRKYITQVKTGLPGVAYVRLDPGTEWPEELQVRLP